jgi:hypothetical protein
MVAEFTTDLIENSPWLDDQARDALSTPVSGRGLRQLGRRAIVVGAGIGGLAATGALAQHFERVDILERDRLATSIASRSGTPQDWHPHGLLAGGLQALDQIFPGHPGKLDHRGAQTRITCLRDTLSGGVFHGQYILQTMPAVLWARVAGSLPAGRDTPGHPAAEAAQELKVRRLAAGGSWIRNFSSATRT